MDKKCEWVFDRNFDGDKLILQCTRLNDKFEFSLEDITIREALIILFSRTLEKALCSTDHLKMKISLTIDE